MKKKKKVPTKTGNNWRNTTYFQINERKKCGEQK
jgi:hypothetical protein